MDAFIITFREGLEAAIAIGVMAAYLAATGRLHLEKWVAAGVASAVILSAGVGILLQGATEIVESALFEGVVYLVAAVFVTTMVVWMLRTGSRASAVIKQHTDAAASLRHPALQAAGIFLVTFLLVAREGIETALFLVASVIERGPSLAFFVAGAAGLLAAFGLGVLVFVGGKKLDLKVFFAMTSVVLIALATRFAASGIAELGEAGALDVPHAIEGVLEAVSVALGHPAALAAMALIPVLGLAWSALRGSGVGKARV